MPKESPQHATTIQREARQNVEPGENPVDHTHVSQHLTDRSMAKDENVLLILVKPTIIIQREQEQKQFPLLSSKPAGT